MGQLQINESMHVKLGTLNMSDPLHYIKIGLKWTLLGGAFSGMYCPDTWVRSMHRHAAHGLWLRHGPALAVSGI